VERKADSNLASLLAQTEALRNYWTQNWRLSENRIQETAKVADISQFQFSLVLADGRNPELPAVPNTNSVNPSPVPSPTVNAEERGIF
ncbi:MAG: hypothetical protein RLZZ568_1692, partial [Cyanobacteriota bacterium]